MVAGLAEFAAFGYGGLVLPVTEDAALVQAIAEGDRRALASLYERYAGLLLGVGMRVLRERGEAEEVLHEVFVEVFRLAGTYDPGRGSVRAWLVLRMRSRSLDRAKSAGRARRTGLKALPAGQLVAPVTGASGDECRLAEVLLALPAEQRVVLELAYFDGLSSSEIAARVGVPVGTVKSRTAAALARLRLVLRAT